MSAVEDTTNGNNGSGSSSPTSSGENTPTIPEPQGPRTSTTSDPGSLADGTSGAGIPQTPKPEISRKSSVLPPPQTQTESGDYSDHTYGSTSEESKLISVIIQPTTGGYFPLQIKSSETVEGLKKTIYKLLKLNNSRNNSTLSLLHRERVLTSGLISDFNIMDGSKLTLVPCIETGLMTPRPESSVLEALEGLNETQINEFLIGKAPLNLTMRLGDHIMLIQLQISKGAYSSHDKHKNHTKSLPSNLSNANPKTDTTEGQSTSEVSTTVNQSREDQPQTVPSNLETSIPDPDPDQKAEATTTLLPDPSVDSSPTESTTPNSMVSDELSGSTAWSSSSSGQGSSKSMLEPVQTVTLQEASRNLTNTLKKLSNKVSHTASRAGQCQSRIKKHQGMHHHGKGIFSGTFSRTLNPRLQEANGIPRRHISTIVHILNDLLGNMDLHYGAGSSNTAPPTTKVPTKRSASAAEEIQGPSNPGSLSASDDSGPTPSKKARLETSPETNSVEHELLRNKLAKLKESLQIVRERKKQLSSVTSSQ